jgi:serine/threonine protein kinase
MESQAGRELPGHQPRGSLRRWDPEMIGPYVVLGRLGSGSMGQVYLGRSAAGRLVAVKTIKIELAEEAGFRTRFAQEVAAAGRVSGVFTAAVVEADPDADVPWLATAFVPAPSLRRMVLTCGPLPVSAVRWLAAGCAEALESIHGAGLVHRDLKPSNVLVAPSGPLVIDFGVARAAERIGVTVSRGAVGTPAYMAPEQAADPRQASAASDVYSLGATLLFAATGHPPYQGASPIDVLARLATEDPDLSGLPAGLTELIAACLERVPRARPTSSALLRQLGDFGQAHAGSAAEHAYLPEPAMALIGEYQRSPQLAGLAPGSEDRAEDDDSTAASFTELPAGYAPVWQGPEPGWSDRRRWLRAHLAWAGWASAGAALIVVGVILGAALSSSSTPSTGQGTTTSSQQAAPAPPPSPPPAPGTLCGSLPVTSGPALCMEQAAGDPDATFTVSGSGFAPQASFTVSLTWNAPPASGNGKFDRTASARPRADRNGTFRFTVNQLFPDAIRQGRFTVVVTEPGGRQASTAFIVLPPSPPG